MLIRHAIWMAAWIAACGVWASADSPATRPATRPVEARAPLTDAALRDVVFIDRLRAWVVGDAGTILHTTDSGLTWRRVASGTTASLERVYFHDRRHGWIVGGLRRRLRSGGYGMVLRTEDGGETWIRVPLPQAGWLSDVRFANERIGWACGEATPEAPAGLIHTTNGGVTWKPVRGGRTAGLFALAVTTSPRGWAAGASVSESPGHGVSLPPLTTRPATGASVEVPANVRPRQVVRFRLGTMEAPPGPFAAPATVRSMQFIGARQGWMAGDAGVICATASGGAAWRRSEMPWESAALAGRDVHRLFFINEALGWAVGRLGSTILTTANGGRRWTAARTANRVPLHGVHFISPTRGLAVGDLGLILRTSDGGRRWQVLHRGDVRSSLLVLVVAPGGYPWTALARYAADRGHRTVVLDWTHLTDEPARSQRAQAVRRACQAVAVPACATIRAAGREALCRELVWAVRTWLPAVIVVATDPNNAARSRMALEAAGKAFDRAADSTLYRNQITGHGLEVWQPRRLVELSPQPDVADKTRDGLGAGTPGLASIPGKVYAARLRDTYSMVGLRAAEQLGQRPTTVMHSDRIRVIREVRKRPPGATERLFRGAYVPAGTAGRRPLTPISPQREDRADRITRATRGLWFAFLLARRHRRMQGFVSMAGDFHRQHPETTEGLEALATAARALEARGDLGLAYVAYEGVRAGGMDCPALPEALYRQAGYLLRGLRDPRLILMLDPTAYDLKRLLAQRRRENERALRHAVERGNLLRTLYPSARGMPALAFRLAAAHRALGQRDEALEVYRRYADWPADTIWGRNARGELSLAGQRGAPPPKPVIVAHRTRRPPVLDGQLTEAAWRVPAARLRRASGAGARHGWRYGFEQRTVSQGSTAGTGMPTPARGRQTRHETTVRFLHDQEALYVAIEGRALGTPTTREAQRRTGYGFGDRLDLLLDVNRDYATHTRFSLELPTRKTQSRSEGVPLQVPWRVRASLRGNRFVVECALPLTCLGVYQIDPNTVWGVNVAATRRDGTQHRLSADAPLETTPAFGYLIFED